MVLAYIDAFMRPMDIVQKSCFSFYRQKSGNRKLDNGYDHDIRQHDRGKIMNV